MKLNSSVNYTIDFWDCWAEAGNGNNGSWNAGVDIVLKVLEVDVGATLSIWPGYTFGEEESMDDMGCANWSGVNKVGGKS